MRVFISSIAIFLANTAIAQYYYKDIVVPEQIRTQMQVLKNNKVRSVKIASFEANGRPVEDFDVSQNYNSNYTSLTTSTRSQVANESTLVTTFDNQGRLVKTTDTTDGFRSSSEYKYDAAGKLTSIMNISYSAGQSQEEEQHLWFYNGNGHPERMLKVKNKSDTTHYTFVVDEKGNVVEENAKRRGSALPSVYYYYDANNRLTDIVRYNQKAKRLLPDYIFEYNNQGQLSSMMVIPEGTDDYQRWIYQYGEEGLKLKETAMNKRKQVLGRLEYQYQK